jgi:hypothetical protein
MAPHHSDSPSDSSQSRCKISARANRFVRFNQTPSPGLERAGDILGSTHPDFVVSKQRLRRAGVIELVREKRETVSQTLGFASRPFVFCGLPVKRPRPGVLVHEGRNRRFLLQVTGHTTRQDDDNEIKRRVDN